MYMRGTMKDSPKHMNTKDLASGLANRGFIVSTIQTAQQIVMMLTKMYLAQMNILPHANL
jgi:hypothetical protein